MSSDNTVVALVSDHGEMNGEELRTALQEAISSILPRGCRFSIQAPGKATDSCSAAPVELMDLGATLVELAGAEPVAGSFARAVSSPRPP